MADNKNTGADIIVQTLNNYDVKYVFGIPGAKIDRLFETLEHPEKFNAKKAPRVIVTKHEQNAAFMAQAVGRITGKAGVAIGTSGPGVTNLLTGVWTAQTENDPMIAIGGQVFRRDLYRRTHQSTPSAEVFKPVTKYAVEIQDGKNIAEVMSNAINIAQAEPKGASFISLPQDIDEEVVDQQFGAFEKIDNIKYGAAPVRDVSELAKKITQAKLPVLLIGTRGSTQNVTNSLHKLLSKIKLPVVETFQGAGVINRQLVDEVFFGRVGLFRNQPGDQLLAASDLVITIGYDAVEYEPRNWHKTENQVITIDSVLAQIDQSYQPNMQLIGDIDQTIDLLSDALVAENYQFNANTDNYHNLMKQELGAPEFTPQPGLNHPLDVIKATQAHVTDDMTVTLDIGSHYIWMSRFFRSYQPRHLLISNGMQTLGVALPWAIASALVRPNTKIVSVSGDGGFLFSGAELETAVREKLNIVQIIWNDQGHYDMVKFQENMKYGQDAAVDFGEVDFVKYAQAMGAKGLRVDDPNKINEVLDEAFSYNNGPVVVDIPVDYSHNTEMYADLLEGIGD